MRRGFTLIELLVAMSIFLILTTMTVVMVNVSMDSERIGSAARQVQSFVLGAKGRASHAGEPRGVLLQAGIQYSQQPTEWQTETLEQLRLACGADCVWHTSVVPD